MINYVQFPIGDGELFRVRHGVKPLILFHTIRKNNHREESVMYEELYSLATLRPEEIDELKELERQMSKKYGQRISLVAYQADISSGKPD